MMKRIIVCTVVIICSCSFSPISAQTYSISKVESLDGQELIDITTLLVIDETTISWNQKDFGHSEFNITKKSESEGETVYQVANEIGDGEVIVKQGSDHILFYWKGSKDLDMRLKLEK